MAASPEKRLTSADIADHIGTNPVVVRRVLGKLRLAGLLISEKGHAGGWKLAKEPESITLADVYLALEENLIAADKSESTSSCAVEHSLLKHVHDVLDEAERDLVATFAKTTISELRTH